MKRTIVDVIEDLLGDLWASKVEKLSMLEIEQFRDVVAEHYADWHPPHRSNDTMRVHLGGWIAQMGAEGLASDLLHQALLYAHEVLVYDPVAAYFEPDRNVLGIMRPVQGASGMTAQVSAAHMEATAGFYAHPDNLEGHRSYLTTAVERIQTLAPLIRSGVVVPVPHLKLLRSRQDPIMAAIRHMLRDDDFLGILRNPVDFPALAGEGGPEIRFLTPVSSRREDNFQRFGDEAWYAARTLALADAAGAMYLPPSATEWALYRNRLNVLGEQLRADQGIHLRVGTALHRSNLPFLEAVSMQTIMAVREQEDAFEHWRARLRVLTRTIQEMPERADFADEARLVLADGLNEVADEVRRKSSKVTSLRTNLRGGSIAFAAGAASVAASGGTASAVAGLGFTGILQWLLTSLVGPDLNGSHAVVAHLALGSRNDSGGSWDWPKREDLVISPK